jgi:hypothetical protein
MPTGANGPQPQDDFAFSYQFDGMYGQAAVPFSALLQDDASPWICHHRFAELAAAAFTSITNRAALEQVFAT